MKYKTKIINDFVLLKKQAEKIQIKIDSLNFKMTEHLTNSVMDRDESQIKKFRNAKKQIIKLLDEKRKLHLEIIQLDFPK